MMKQIAPMAITRWPLIYVYWLVMEPVRLLYFLGVDLGFLLVQSFATHDLL